MLRAGAPANVTLTGTNFTGATAVRFGGSTGIATPTFTVVSATSIRANVPAGMASPSAAIAVIIAPGAIIKRQDGTVQVRNDATARSLAVNYLDIAYGEDNANFADYSSNGFVAGPVRDASSGNQVTVAWIEKH